MKKYNVYIDVTPYWIITKIRSLSLTDSVASFWGLLHFARLVTHSWLRTEPPNVFSISLSLSVSLSHHIYFALFGSLTHLSSFFALSFSTGIWARLCRKLHHCPNHIQWFSSEICSIWLIFFFSCGYAKWRIRLIVRGQDMQMCHALRCKLSADNMESRGTSFLKTSKVDSAHFGSWVLLL